MNWVGQLFTGVDKMTDILNLGRLVFYTAAGALAYAPLWLLIYLLRAPQIHGQSYFRHLDVAIGKLGEAGSGYSFWFISMVLGFLIAGAAFVKVIAPLSVKVKMQLDHEEINKHGFPYNYPMLVQGTGKSEKTDAKDYASWFIAEYFRYVEIVTYIPVGLLLGVSLMALHSGLFLMLRLDAGGITEGHVVFMVINLVAATLWLYIWPEVWKPRVILPVLKASESAKRALVQAVLDRKEAQPEQKIAAATAPQTSS